MYSSNVVSFRVNPRPKLSVEVSRDDSDVFFVVAVRLDVCTSSRHSGPRIPNVGSTQ